MTTVTPEGEKLRKAVKWISETRQNNPERPLKGLVETACFKFNLTPKEADYLLKWAEGEQ